MATAHLTPDSPLVQPAVPTAGRLLSLDTYRGLVMLLLVLLDAPNNWTAPIIESTGERSWAPAVVEQFQHVEWQGLALWDMIQPSFMFMVGAAAAFSYASRARRGHSYGRMLGHAIYRAVALVLLGVFLRSVGHPQTRWTFEDVVSQIGLGYVPLFLLWNRGWRIQLGAIAAILAGYWLLFAAWPLPGPEYNYAAVHGQTYYEGFFAHWNKNAHPAHYFDQWLLNLFPRSTPFLANAGGYNTLNFIPSLATMAMGLMAGELLRSAAAPRKKLWALLSVGLACCGLGLAMEFAGLCPIVKKIWTPSFALVSGGLCLCSLGGLYWAVDVAGWRRWTLPAVVVGQNSIAAYALIHLIAGATLAALHRHLGEGLFEAFGEPYQPLLENLAVGTIVWLICYWLYRRSIFIRL